LLPHAFPPNVRRAVRARCIHHDQPGSARQMGYHSVRRTAMTERQTRVGIATWLVVVGDVIGAGSAQEQSVVGEMPNLAAHLQVLAEPDCLDRCRHPRLVGALFEYRDLGAVEVKGIAGPVSLGRCRVRVSSRAEVLRGSTIS